MKYLFIFIILIFALPGFGQQDSVVYEKRVNDTNVFQGSDSIYFKITYVKDGNFIKSITFEPFTDVDSLMAMVFFNEYTDASRQYKQAIEAWEAQEKGYELRLRQADPSAQTYLEVTNLSSNHNTVRFICAQPSGSTYYWIFLKQ